MIWTMDPYLDDLPRLDLAGLSREHLLPGAAFELNLGRGFRAGTCVERDHLSLSVRLGVSHRINTDVLLDRTLNNFGGRRTWVLCPNQSCMRRCRILYVHSNRLACRHCTKLRYRVEYESRLEKIIRRARKKRTILGWSDDLTSGMGSKPERMHWRTYGRHLNAAYQAEQEMWRGVISWSRRNSSGVDMA